MLADETAHRGLAYLELSGGLRKRDLSSLGARPRGRAGSFGGCAKKHTRAVQPLPRAVVLPARLCRLAMALSGI